MARNDGVRVRAYNRSDRQIQFARQRAAAEGPNSQAEFVESDYRNLSGQFDAFVSMGMLEHAGRKCYYQLGPSEAQVLIVNRTNCFVFTPLLSKLDVACDEPCDQSNRYPFPPREVFLFAFG